MTRSTHTVALMEVSRTIHDFIKAELLKAGYSQAIISVGDKEALDMHGLALVVAPGSIRELMFLAEDIDTLANYAHNHDGDPDDINSIARRIAAALGVPLPNASDEATGKGCRPGNKCTGQCQVSNACPCEAKKS